MLRDTEQARDRDRPSMVWYFVDILQEYEKHMGGVCVCVVHINVHYIYIELYQQINEENLCALRPSILHNATF